MGMYVQYCWMIVMIKEITTVVAEGVEIVQIQISQKVVESQQTSGRA